MFDINTGVYKQPGKSDVSEERYLVQESGEKPETSGVFHGSC